MPNEESAPDFAPDFAPDDAEDTEVQAVAEALREIVAADLSPTGDNIRAVEQAAELLELLSA